MDILIGYYMQRAAQTDLIEWLNQEPRMPLLLRGARQVGKTTLINDFAHQYFKDNWIEINFELEPKFKDCFNSLNPTDIITAINFRTQKQITPNKTLLFLDEIQECPQAILALRYFKEKMPQLHVIAAGSLLEFTLNKPDFRMPVGRIQSLYINPLSFLEFLQATEPEDNIHYLRQLDIDSTIPAAIHDKLMENIKTYLLLGGMPAIVNSYLTSKDFNRIENLQGSLLNNYRNDFGKYDGKINLSLLQDVYSKLPGLVAQHFKYSRLDIDARSREIKPVLQALYDAGLAYSVHACHGSGLPLAVGKNERRFKLLFVDVGLMQHSLGVTGDLYRSQDIMLINQGQVVEQFVGQELLAYAPRYEVRDLYYWDRDVGTAQAEIDYLYTYKKYIIPIEVKAGKSGRLRSLHIFLKEKNARLGLKISSAPLSINDNLLSVPLYLLWKLPDFMQQLTARDLL